MFMRCMLPVYLFLTGMSLYGQGSHLSLDKDTYNLNECAHVEIENPDSIAVYTYIALETIIEGDWVEVDSDILNNKPMMAQVLTIRPGAQQEVRFCIKDIDADYLRKESPTFRLKLVYGAAFESLDKELFSSPFHVVRP